ncbi:MAG TPA: hypothetical protein VF843_16480 [Streptosporangiaceae bacterium]
MADLIYPEFPRRVFLACGVVVLALAVAAVVINRHGPSVDRCTAAARRAVASHGQVSPGQLRACDGLSTAQLAIALTTAYRAEYARYLRGAPITGDLPSASYRSASARAAARRS